MREVACGVGMSIALIAIATGFQEPARADDTPPSIYEPGLQNQAIDLLNQSLGSINRCYQGAHGRWFTDDVAGRALEALVRKAAEPGGLCEQYAQRKVPVDLKVPLGPGAEVPVDKVCELVRRSSCNN